MLDSLIRIIKRPAGPMRPGRVEVAAAALLVEVARLGEGISEDHRDAISDAVRDRFLLSPIAAAALMTLASRREDAPYTDWSFAAAVQETFDTEERKKLVRHVRQVASTDGVLSKIEDKLLARIAQAIALPQEDLAALRAEAAAPAPKTRRARS